MSKILKNIGQFLFLLCLISISTGAMQAYVVDAASIPIDPGAISEFEKSSVPVPAGGADGQDINGTELLIDVVFNALTYVKMIIAVVGLIYALLLGYTLITASGDEEVYTTAKKSLTYMIVGFVLIGMAQRFGEMLDMRDGVILSSGADIRERVNIFNIQVEIFMTFVKYIVGAYATILLVRNGLKLITGGGEEEEASKAKKSILYSASGLIFIFIGDIAINKVFYKITNTYTGVTGVDPMIDAEEGVAQLVGVTNLVMSFVGPVAVLMLIVSAVMYATAGGKEEDMEKAKRVIITTVVGILIIYGAFALVSTIITGKLADAGAIIN